LFTTVYKRLAEGGWGLLIGGLLERVTLLLLLALCVSVSLRTETLNGTWDSANLRAKTLREIKENMGQ
jgi:hypothetical protein